MTLNARLLLLEEVGLVFLLAIETKLGGGVFVLIFRSVLDGLGGAELSSVLVPGPKGEEGDLNESGQTDPEGNSSAGGIGDSSLDRSIAPRKRQSVHTFDRVITKKKHKREDCSTADA